jgi:hypothetical protein
MRFKLLVAGVGLALLVILAGCQSDSTNANPAQAASGGPVRITLDHSAYGVNDPLGITVSNTGDRVFYAVDGKSACTFMQLQKYDSGKKQWATIDACTIAYSPHPLQMPAGIAEPFSLAPGSPSDQNAWETGTYRVAVVYSENADGTTGAQTAYSPEFAIR